jgi:hypothetical protein
MNVPFDLLRDVDSSESQLSVIVKWAKRSIPRTFRSFK